MSEKSIKRRNPNGERLRNYAEAANGEGDAVSEGPADVENHVSAVLRRLADCSRLSGDSLHVESARLLVDLLPARKAIVCEFSDDGAHNIRMRAVSPADPAVNSSDLLLDTDTLSRLNSGEVVSIQLRSDDSHYCYPLISSTGITLGFVALDMAARLSSDSVPAAVLDLCLSRIVADLERERQEIRTRISDDRYQKTLNEISVGVFISDPKGKVEYINPAACEMLGQTSRNTVGQTAGSLNWPVCDENLRLLPMEERPVRRTISSGLPVRNTVYSYVRPDNGERVWGLVNTSILENETGEADRILTTFTLITPLKEAEEELLKRKQADDEFHLQLKHLHEFSLELGSVNSIDDLCRRAVIATRDRFGFDRASVWLMDSHRKYAHGTYGIGENGFLRTEYGKRLEEPESFVDLASFLGATVQQNRALHNDNGEQVGVGWHGCAPLRDRAEELGLLWVDNLLSGEPFSEAQIEILGLLGATVGNALSRILSNNEVRRSERRFRDFFEALPLGVTIYGPDRKPLLTNPALQRILGYPISEFTILKATHPDDAEEGLQLYQEMEAGRRDSYSREKRYIRKDGRVIWANHTSTAIRDDSGELQYVIMTVEDITESKLAKDALRLSEERFHALFEQAAVGMAVLDLKGFPLEINRALLDLLGYTKEEMQGGAFTRITHQEDIERNWKVFLELANGSRDSYLIEKRYICKDGSSIWGRVTTSLVRDAQGKPSFAVGIVENITERKEAEQSLWESEERFRKVFENGPLGIALSSQDLQIKLANEAFCKMTGYTAEELQSGTFLDITHPDDIEASLEFAARSRTGHPESSFEKRYLTKSGEAIWVHVSIATVRNRDGEFVYYLAMIENITPRKRVESALRESEIRYRNLIEQSPDPVCITIGDTLVYVNRAYRQLTGSATREEMLGRSIYEFAPADDNYVENMRERRRRVLEIGDLDPWFEGILVPRDGQPINVEVTLFPVVFEGQIAVQSVVRDVTEANRQKAAKLHAEQALRASESRFHAIFSQAAIGIALVDANGHPAESNTALHQMLGYTAEELKSMAFTEFTHPDDVRADWKLYQELASGKRDSYQIEKRFIRKDGQEIWGRLTVSLVRGDDGSPLFGIGMAENISERKDAERSLTESLERLQTLTRHLQSVREEERASVAREVHDELGQSLTGMRMVLSEMKRSIERSRDSLDPEVVLGKISSINGMIEDTIRNVRRIATDLRPAILDTLGLVATMKWQAQDFQKRTKITCRFLTDIEDITLDSEIQTAMFRIFQESLTNILRHSGATTVRASLDLSGKCLRLAVRDNGRGITDADIAQSKSFGLLGMKERAQLLGGTLTIKGVPGSGTTITVNMPVRLSQKSQE